MGPSVMIVGRELLSLVGINYELPMPWHRTEGVDMVHRWIFLDFCTSSATSSHLSHFSATSYHFKPLQTTSNHVKPRQTTSNHVMPLQVAKLVHLLSRTFRQNFTSRDKCHIEYHLCHYMCCNRSVAENLFFFSLVSSLLLITYDYEIRIQQSNYFVSFHCAKQCNIQAYPILQ